MQITTWETFTCILIACQAKETAGVSTLLQSCTIQCSLTLTIYFVLPKYTGVSWQPSIKAFEK